MNSNDIRHTFLNFFAKYDHKVVSSAPVVPIDDPTLLFTNAGMNQFKDVFLNTGKRPYSRAVDTQKCIRVSGKHNDLEEVGYDTYHHTFFEMLGNWSFGDYYKEEAIAWAWELITGIWGLPKDKLWATIFRDDDEAEKIWKKGTDIRSSQILRFDEKDNFWEMGDIGPCGPCSEIHIDLGAGSCDQKGRKGHICGINTGCARFIELWNLVFIQFNRDPSGKLHLLPKKHVDTGLGFERIVAVLQGKRSNYQTDLFVPIMEHIQEITGKSYQDNSLLPSFRVISDHIRALTFAIADGALPSNEGRGYVLRRILRRAARYGRNLDMHESFLYRLVSTVVDVMGEAFPEIRERAQHSTMVIKAEEERFNEVLDRGISLFESIVSDLKQNRKKSVPGKEAFKLYDTFGFPFDLTQLMASEMGLNVDEKGFKREMNIQKERARESHRFAAIESGEWESITPGADSEFLGYETIFTKSKIRKLRQDGKHISLVLNKTPFYAESGGQVGDQGEIKGDGFRIRVEDAQKQGDMVIHQGSFIEGLKILSPDVEATVEPESRISTARNHTATHLLHKALRHVLGDQVNQAGSLVAPDRLRFDFTHIESMKDEQIERVEKIVNQQIVNDHPVEKFNTTFDEAKARGATALFGEKYGDHVRVVKIDEYSMELCGGTHLDRTGEIGYFRIIKEEGIAAGVRRIEAVTGLVADALLREEKQILSHLGTILKCRRDDIENRVQEIIDERKNLERKIKELQMTSAGSDIEDIINRSIQVDDFRVVSSSVKVPDIDTLRNTGDRLREKLNSGIGVLGAVLNNKVHFLCVVTDDLIKSRNMKAGDIVRRVAVIADGSGGGKPHLALAGGKNVHKLQEALDAVPDIVKNRLK